MAEKKYWKGLAEKYNDSDFQDNQSREFRDKLPGLENNLESASSNRRDFLKVLGFSVTAAAVAAGCEIDVRKSIPYVIKPDEITPGVANYYATTIMDGSSYGSILVKTREGRPIKIDGNKLSDVSKGGTDAVTQASVLNLYDTNRIKGPSVGVAVNTKATEWSDLDNTVKSKLKAISAKGGTIKILSSTVISPTLKKVISEFSQTYGNVDLVEYDAVSYSGLLDAVEEITLKDNKRFLPNYKFDKASDVVVGIGADFLGTWLSPVEYAPGYMQNRKVNADNPKMSKHYQFESYMSLTGSNADKRIVVKPSEEGLAVLHLYNKVASKTGASSISGLTKLDAITMEGINAAAKDLLAAKGKSLVVCGVNDKNVQLVTLAINNLLGNFGSTVDLLNHSNLKRGDDKAVKQLVKDMEGGKVDALFVYNANPAYNLPNATAFTAALSKVSLTVSLSNYLDETQGVCEYVAPDHHFLEAWNDAEPKNGSLSLAQPTISPLFKTRSAAESFLTWKGSDVNYYDYLRKNWKANYFPKQSKYSSFNEFWDRSLHNGVVEVSPAWDGVFRESYSVDASAAGNAASSSFKVSDGTQVALYQKVGIKDGMYANNPWLQELPDPISKITWDNYACVSERFAKDNSLGNTLDNSGKDAEKYDDVDVLKVTVNGLSVELPAVIQPGTPQNTIAVAVGYGRTSAGLAGTNVGVNVYPLVNTKGNSNLFFGTGATFEKTGKTYKIAQTQHHFNIYDGLNERKIVKETTLEEYKGDNKSGNKDRDKIKKQLQTLYGLHESYETGHHWGMSIDLNSCYGCGACVIACHSENNVPVVGKYEVRKSREMHWMRIDRYYSGDEDNPQSIFQPLMCQHCDAAPCENVCPVSATNHSDEGLNQMAYNRCVGTRYCANNCPYKVRRFNWFDYNNADSFTKGSAIDNEFDPYDQTNDLTRMVLNPDVTIRARGVMEKCSFCNQRIQEGKLTAKKEGRKLKDGDVITACQSACHVGAIQFGDLNDKESAIVKDNENERAFKVIEETHVLPSVTYLTKVRNKGKNEA